MKRTKAAPGDIIEIIKNENGDAVGSQVQVVNVDDVGAQYHSVDGDLILDGEAIYLSSTHGSYKIISTLKLN